MLLLYKDAAAAESRSREQGFLCVKSSKKFRGRTDWTDGQTPTGKLVVACDSYCRYCYLLAALSDVLTVRIVKHLIDDILVV